MRVSPYPRPQVYSHCYQMNPQMVALHMKHKAQKEEEKKQVKMKMALHKFLDPFLPHRIVGDFIIPDKLSPYQGDYLYSYKLDLTHKQLHQIHLRKHGVILEYEENDPYYLPPMEMVQARLESLGNLQAYELSKYIVEYQNKMTVKTEAQANVKVEDQGNKSKSKKKVNNDKIFSWMDSQMENHQEDLVFMRGNKVISQNDFRMCFMAFNFKFLEWVVSKNDLTFLDDTMLEEIAQCFVFRNAESYLEEISSFMKSKIFNLNSGHDFVLDIKTLIGVFSLKMQFIFEYFQESNKTVFCFVHPKNFQKKEINEEIRRKRAAKLNVFKRGPDWGKLVSLYYKDYSLRNDIMKTDLGEKSEDSFGYEEKKIKTEMWTSL